MGSRGAASAMGSVGAGRAWGWPATEGSGMRGTARGRTRGRTRRNERSRRIGDGMASSRFGLRSLTAALLMLLLVAGSVSLAGVALADPSPGSMHVVVPTPSNDGKTVQGPVGTNVSVSAGQATANATYTLGW